MDPVRAIEIGGAALVAAGIMLGALTITESTNPVPSSQLASVGQTLTTPVEESELVVHYIEIIGGCDHQFNGDCVVARHTPSAQGTVATKLRKGVVLEVASTTVQSEGEEWYRVTFTEWMRYPGRVSGEWYVRAMDVTALTDPGPQFLSGDVGTTTKRIIVDRSEQKLYAYDGEILFLASPISTGLELTPTPRGTFQIFRQTPSRYMQGPLPGISDQYYDLPGVPWDLYFTEEGGAIHGAYWHDSFGRQWSHGCVNLPLIAAKTLYDWADIGTPVTVQD